MRIVSGYDSEGHKIYRDLGPSNGASGPALVRGSLVVGESVEDTAGRKLKRYYLIEQPVQLSLEDVA